MQADRSPDFEEAALEPTGVFLEPRYIPYLLLYNNITINPVTYSNTIYYLTLSLCHEFGRGMAGSHRLPSCRQLGLLSPLKPEVHFQAHAGCCRVHFLAWKD